MSVANVKVPAVNPVAMFQAAIATEDAKKAARSAARKVLLAQAHELLAPLRLAFEEAIKAHEPTKDCILSIGDEKSLQYDVPIKPELIVAVHSGHEGWIKQNLLTLFGVREIEGRARLQHYEAASCGMVASEHVFDDWISAFQFGIKEVAARVARRSEQ